MIWPVRKKDPYTMNTARGLHPRIGDRMDLTLECIRRHYAGEPGNLLAAATTAYEDFFDLFDDFKGFVKFFHFQDLVRPDSDYEKVEYFLPLENFKRLGTPTSKDEYVEYRHNVLKFIELRSVRMVKWVMEGRPRFRFASSALVATLPSSPPSGSYHTRPTHRPCDLRADRGLPRVPARWASCTRAGSRRRQRPRRQSVTGARRNAGGGQRSWTVADPPGVTGRPACKACYGRSFECILRR